MLLKVVRCYSKFLCQSLCVCRLSLLLRPQFLFDFHEILQSGSGLQNKIEFVWSENPMSRYVG